MARREPLGDLAVVDVLSREIRIPGAVHRGTHRSRTDRRAGEVSSVDVGQALQVERRRVSARVVRRGYRVALTKRVFRKRKTDSPFNQAAQAVSIVLFQGSGSRLDVFKLYTVKKNESR